MAGVLQHLRSSTLDKRPNPASMVDGQVAINYASGAPGMFFKDSNGDLVKVGPVHVGSGAPNAVPASGGTAGNSIGEQWLDTSGGTYVFKIWDGSAWRSEAGEFVNVTGDTMTGALGIIAGSEGSPSLFISGDTDTGLYSPGANQLAISTNGTGRLFVDSSGHVGIPGQINLGNQESTGTSGALKLISTGGVTYFQSAQNTSSASAAPVVFTDYNASNEWLRITSDGKLGLGTSTPGDYQSGKNNLVIANTGGSAGLTVASTSTGYGEIAFADGTTGDDKYRGQISYDHTNDALAFFTAANERVRIDSSGRVGIGTTSPQELLHVNTGSSGGQVLRMSTNGADTGYLYQNSGAVLLGAYSTRVLGFETNGSERARIDSSGRLLVGTSTARTDYFNNSLTAMLQVEGTNYGGSVDRACVSIVNNNNVTDAEAPVLVFGRSRGSTVNSKTLAGNGTRCGYISFQGADGGDMVEAASIAGEVDGTSGANDMPGRLVFSTTADGASSPTERMRIDSNGEVEFTNSRWYKYLGIRTALTGYDPNTQQYVVVNRGNSGTGSFVGVGLNVGATSWSTYSDERSKTDLVPIENGLDKIGALRAVTGRYKEDEIGVKRSLLIAQDVQHVLPEAVDTSNPEKLGLRYTEVIPLLVAALKEAKEKIETLESKVNALEGN